MIKLCCEKELIMISLGERIIELRKSNNLSQEMLADKVGVSRQAISKWERNEATPDIYNAKAVADVFGISVDVLLHGDNDSGTIYKREDIRSKAQLGITISVGLYILSAFSLLILPFSTEVNVFIFGVAIVIATVLIIYSSLLYDKFKRINAIDEGDAFTSSSTSPEARKVGNLTAAVCMSTIAIYLYLGFVHHLWHPGWLVFALIPVSTMIFGAVFSKKTIIDI